uniref:Uncharacterized protein n=1 Tax=Eutreptiella gymnastica TaxID=73025 RepID=A0A7S4GFK3_9EUGL|mmetsp:Transcript_11183/g.17272  ORF Transcript_11183/g.17272 Transcript_11183/m.17272 type:complete len:149 (-) Transcript_11183:103-549(-)
MMRVGTNLMDGRIKCKECNGPQLDPIIAHHLGTRSRVALFSALWSISCMLPDLCPGAVEKNGDLMWTLTPEFLSSCATARGMHSSVRLWLCEGKHGAQEEHVHGVNRRDVPAECTCSLCYGMHFRILMMVCTPFPCYCKHFAMRALWG